MDTQGKILIVGGSGFIGYHLHQVLAGRRLVNMDLKAPEFPCHSEFRQGDIRSLSDLCRIIVPGEFDAIINLAAEHKDFGISREDYFATNESGTRNLVQSASVADVNKVIFYSSVAVYGDNSAPSNEELPPAPVNDYGRSKLAAEKVLQAWAAEQQGRQVVIIRPTVVYGERNFANVYRLIKQIKSGAYFTVGRGANIKSMAYVKNLVAATVYLMEHAPAGVEIFNYADEPHLTSGEIGACIAAALGKRPPISLPYPLVYLLALPFDLLIKLTGRDLPISTKRVQKLCTPTHHQAGKLSKLGFRASHNNNQGLGNMVAWMQAGERTDG